MYYLSIHGFSSWCGHGRKIWGVCIIKKIN
jgi:hypothetical protein